MSLSGFFSEIIADGKKALTGVAPIITAAAPIVQEGAAVVATLDPAAAPIITAGENAVSTAMSLLTKMETFLANASPEFKAFENDFASAFTKVGTGQATVLVPTTTAATTPATTAAAAVKP